MIRFILLVWRNFKEYIVLVLLLITSLVTLSLNQKPEIKKVRAVAFGTFASVTSIVSDLINSAKLRSENERLLKINAELMLQVNRLRNYGIMNTELKGLVGLKDTSSFPLIPASIVSRSLNKAQSTITINVGTSSGVKAGMPVKNDQGLIGIVHSISEDFAIARTLKNIDLKITVKDERSRVDGVLKWNGEELVIIDVPKTYDIETGDRIITSDLSSIIPVPIPVGFVTGLNKVETGIFNEVIVKPFVDFTRIENIFVLGIIHSKQKNDLELNFFNLGN